MDQRAVVPLPAKLGLLARAAGAALLPAGPSTAAPLPATRHLVAAVAAAPAPPPVPGRLVWLLELFADLDSRQGAASAGRTGA